MLAIQNRKILAVSLSITIFILIFSFYFIFYESLSRLDHGLLDSFFQLRGPVYPGDDIVIVALDRESSRQMQRKAAGWQRSDFADAIEKLSAAGADLIAIDYIFAIPDQDPAQDEGLRSALEKSANVILASDISERNRALPYPLFREQEVGEGFLNLFPDDDGVVRTIPPLHATVNEGGTLALDFPFSVQVAVAKLYPQGDFKPDLTQNASVKLGDLQIPYVGSEPSDGFWINFTGPSEHFPVIPIYKILKNEFTSSEVSGRIVLIGSMNPYYHDYYTVPFRVQKAAAEKTIQSMYGVEIHANAIHTLLRRRFLAPVSRQNLCVTLLVLALITTVLSIGVRWNAFLISAILLLLVIAFWYGSYRLFVSGIFVAGSPVYFAILLISLTGLIARQADEAAERKYITQLFGRYVAPNVVQELIRNRDLVQFSGRKQRLTIFFSDIRGFTSMSEKLQPEEVSSLLNEYFSHMTRIVFKHMGTLDKFMGDAIMAFFGNPVYFWNHAERAVEMALEMKDEMQKLKAKWESERKEHSFDIGMGINTGEVVVGNLGSTEFFDYTVIGDEVNLACRLESIAKRGQIIISAGTYEEVKDNFDVIKLDPVTVKGKTQPVQIYEVLKRR